VIEKQLMKIINNQNPKEPQGKLNKYQNCYKPKFQQIFPKKMSQSRFLEAPLVRQEAETDGELHVF
jgi:hypothetical protein